MNKSFFLVFLFWGIISCGNNTEPSDGIPLAKVGDDILYYHQILETVPPNLLRSDSIRIVDNFIDDWIRRKVLHQEALRLGLDKTHAYKAKMQDFGEQILAELLRELVIYGDSGLQKITEQDVHTFYEQHRNQFVLQERHVRLRHMVTRTNQEAEIARNALLSGISWSDIAEEHSIDPEYAKHIETQLIPASSALTGLSNMQSFLNVIGIGEVSLIRREGEYYHFIQLVEDKARGEHPELDVVFEQIREWLQSDQIKRTISAYEQNLILQAGVNNEIIVF